MDNLNLDQLASDYEAWLKQHDRKALKVHLAVLVIVFGSLATMGQMRDTSSRPMLISILVLVGVLTLVIVILVRFSKKFLTDPHPLTKLVSQSETPEVIRMHLELTDRAKRQVESQLYFRASRFGDDQARAYFKGDPWEEMPAGAAIPYEQLIDAPNLNLLATQPGWARWSLQPLLGSAFIGLISAGLYGFE